MKVFFVLLTFSAISCIAFAQDGRILEKKQFILSDTVIAQLTEVDPELTVKLSGVNFYRITYFSDGLKITGYTAEPKEKGIYPCLLVNRGGNREFGKWTPFGLALFLGRMATWNYIAIASQYRGVEGGEGKEEFGGSDVQDVLNLVPVLDQIPGADTSRIGMEGGSRGGMMTYLALKASCRFRAAAVVAGAANAFTLIKSRPEMEKNVYAELIPAYWKNKEAELKNRSAVLWADELCKSTPLLIMHGSSDWRVLPSESLELVQKLYEYKHPVRFILYEGADHELTEFRKEMFEEMRRHFDFYVRDRKKNPSMQPHGR